MAPPKYKDLGKAAKDILDEDFKFEQTFELKSKLNGIDLKSTFSDKGKGLAGNLEAKMGVDTVGDVTLKVDHSFESPQLVVENSKLVQGLKLKAEVPCLPDQLSKKGIVISPEYKHDVVMMTAKAETGKQQATVDAAFAAGPATVGVKATVKADATISGIEAAAEYKSGSLVVAGNYGVDKGNFSGSVHTSLNSETDVALKFDSSGDVNLGANYKIDKDSNVKAKVDKAGIISLFYKQSVRKDLTIKVMGAINSGNLSGPTAHKWGVQMLMSM